MWRCSRPEGLSPESTRFSAEHLIGSSCNRKKANEIFHNLSSCDTRSINELVSGAILHKLQLVQPMIYDYIHYYSVYTAKLTLASQVLLNSCAQTLNIWDPEYQKNYFYRRVKSYPYGILLLHDFCKHTNIFHVMELILMWMPMQGIKFRDFISVVCTSNSNGSPASAKLNKGKNCFALELVPVSKWK